MILQALTTLYEDLIRRGEIARPGWCPAKINYALCIDEGGELLQVIPLLQEPKSEKEKPLRHQEKVVPMSRKRSSAISPNFIWDNSSYFFGFSLKDKHARSQMSFQESRKFHHNLLDSVDTPFAKAILRYFDGWNISCAKEHPVLKPLLEEFTPGDNFLFRFEGTFAYEDPSLVTAWDQYYNDDNDQTMQYQCLVTGEKTTIARTHPPVKGIYNGQSMGNVLVSFDKDSTAFSSYGKLQGFNAPISEYAAFAYTAALNHLLADRDNVHRIGDTTVVCWAEGAEPAYRKFSSAAIFGAALPEKITTAALRSGIKQLANGLPCEELKLDPRRPFHILGLAPNVARLSVRFYYRSTFGELMKNVNDHHRRMEISGSFYETVPLWAMLRETVNLNTTDKSPNPVMAGAVARAIFSGTAYPAALLEATMLRIRAEREITPGRAAILKAYYLKNPSEQCPKEVLTVSLNENSTNIPYTLGRLFYVYEHIQEEANPGINATIRDKYFNSAAATPSVIFPILAKLSKSHLRKLSAGRQIYFERLLGQLKDICGESYPTRLTLAEQGSFDLGYYQQKQYRYTKKED